MPPVQLQDALHVRLAAQEAAAHDSSVRYAQLAAPCMIRAPYGQEFV